MKAESLGIPQKLQLKVDVETGKLIIKKSKDSSEDKFYTHKKSKAPHVRKILVLLISLLWSAVRSRLSGKPVLPGAFHPLLGSLPAPTLPVVTFQLSGSLLVPPAPWDLLQTLRLLPPTLGKPLALGGSSASVRALPTRRRADVCGHPCAWFRPC